MTKEESKDVKVAYLLGAGASAGGGADDGSFSLPTADRLIDDIAGVRKEIGEFKKDISKIDGQEEQETVSKCEEVEQDLDWLIKISKQSNTVDTAAKKLLMSNKNLEYETLKIALSFYFIYRQRYGNIDKRYDNFWATTLSFTNMLKNIKIFTWNYDSQLELSYQHYNDSELRIAINPGINVYSRSYDDAAECYKLNGTADYLHVTPADQKHMNVLQEVIKLQEEGKKIRTILDRYYKKRIGINEKNNKFFESGGSLTSIQFAWENRELDNKYFQDAKTSMKQCDILIIIGYSFPLVNREIDKELIPWGSFKKIFVQSPDDVLKSKVSAFFDVEESKLVHVRDIDTFFA